MTATAAPPAFEVYDDRFATVLAGAAVTRLAETDAHEGPVYVPADTALYVTSVPTRGADGVPQVAIRRIAVAGAPAVTTVRGNANMANGMAAPPRWPAGCLRTGHAAHAGAHHPVRPGHRPCPVPGGRLGRAAAELAQRRGRPLRWQHLVHRSQLRPPAGVPATPRTGDYVYRYDPATGRL